MVAVVVSGHRGVVDSSSTVISALMTTAWRQRFVRHDFLAKLTDHTTVYHVNSSQPTYLLVLTAVCSAQAHPACSSCCWGSSASRWNGLARGKRAALLVWAAVWGSFPASSAVTCREPVWWRHMVRCACGASRRLQQRTCCAALSGSCAASSVLCDMSTNSVIHGAAGWVHALLQGNALGRGPMLLHLPLRLLATIRQRAAPAIEAASDGQMALSDLLTPTQPGAAGKHL